MKQETNPEPENTGNKDQTSFDDNYLAENIVEMQTEDGKSFVCGVIIINSPKKTYL